MDAQTAEVLSTILKCSGCGSESGLGVHPVVIGQPVSETNVTRLCRACAVIHRLRPDAPKYPFDLFLTREVQESLARRALTCNVSRSMYLSALVEAFLADATVYDNLEKYQGVTGTVRVHVYFPRTVYMAFQAKCTELNTTMSEALRGLLQYAEGDST